jgi:hypothetical protein
MFKFNSATGSQILLAGLGCASIVAVSALGAERAGIPDFSGMWGRNAFNFEPLPAGPRPLTNLRRRPDGTGDANKLVGDYNNPILKPQAAEIVKQKGELSLAGKNYPDPSNQCSAYAPPFTFAMQLGMQILQQKDRITMIYNQDDQVRHLRLNAKHPAQVTPSPMGDSVGHYEGDTLVVDTVGIKTGRVAMVDRYGTPHSDALHVVERYRLIDGAKAKEAAEGHIKEDGSAGLGGNVAVDADYKGMGLQLQFTVEDEKMFTMPWSAAVTYRRIKGPWTEQICAENFHEYHTGNDTEIPRADKPDF